MARFNTKLSTQEQIKKKLTKIHENFKKEPKIGLKKINRLNEWLVRLEEVWEQFTAGHEELMDDDEQFFASEYFQQKVFEQCKAMYDEV